MLCVVAPVPFLVAVVGDTVISFHPSGLGALGLCSCQPVPLASPFWQGSWGHHLSLCCCNYRSVIVVIIAVNFCDPFSSAGYCIHFFTCVILFRSHVSIGRWWWGCSSWYQKRKKDSARIRNLLRVPQKERSRNGFKPKFCWLLSHPFLLWLPHSWRDLQMPSCSMAGSLATH